MFLGKTKQETKSVLNTDSRREQGGGRDWAPCLSSSFSSPTELCSTGCSPCSFCLMELGLARQPAAAAAAARLNEKNKGRAVTQLRPFQLRPFQQRPFQLRPFQLRPFQLRPFQLQSFQPPPPASHLGWPAPAFDTHCSLNVPKSSLQGDFPEMPDFEIA